MLSTSAVDHEFRAQVGSNQSYKINICWVTSDYYGVRAKTGWLANVSELSEIVVSVV